MNDPTKPLLQRHAQATKPTAVAPVPDMARPGAVVGVDPVYMALRHAFTVERCPGGWSFVTVKYRDDGTIDSIERSQPDLKPIILEHFKIAALKYWTAQ